MRISPKNPEDIGPHPNVGTLESSGNSGFILIEATLKPGENVCWRCGQIAMDPDHVLRICPVCGKDFNG